MFLCIYMLKKPKLSTGEKTYMTKKKITIWKYAWLPTSKDFIQFLFKRLVDWINKYVVFSIASI